MARPRLEKTYTFEGSAEEAADLTISEKRDIEERRYSEVLIALLRGVIYQTESPDKWEVILRRQAQIDEYMGKIGLRLFVDVAEGYAFLQSIPVEDDDPERPLPRLMPRRQLTYPVSLVLALLRKKLAEFDAQGAETRLILSRDEIVDMVRIFLPESSFETRITERVEAHLAKIEDLGFVRRLKGQERMYEVMRILKTFIDAAWLADFDARLAEYLEHYKTLREQGIDDFDASRPSSSRRGGRRRKVQEEDEQDSDLDMETGGSLEDEN